MTGENDEQQSLASRVDLDGLLSDGETLEFSGRNGFFTSKRAFLMADGMITVVPYDNIKYTQLQEPREDNISLIGEAFILMIGIVSLAASMTAPMESVQLVSGIVGLLCFFISIISTALKLSKQTRTEAKTILVLEENERFTIFSSEIPKDALQSMGEIERLKVESVN